ncbi:ABC transporter ATP-binding protein [Candidatus Bipolaricaulota bacterium]|nr:ABC transporter ATP-binding protein [Candidatus Bipolaricaulota bacterium]MBS3814140.1 ABC transporter ATP-binding protein [Candidatus Bipolaricaulota bacterium]MBS3825170.1 ABC transporter ATP-binding protein [Candidatus Bipolaricaulota bacterium]
MKVEIRNLTKHFGDLIAVDSVSLTFEDGKLTTLLGPSGCGKTSTLRCISGFYEPDEGEVYLGDSVVNQVPPHRRNVATVFQNLGIFPHMTVFENVAYGLRVKKRPKSEIQDRANELLRMVGLGDLGERYPKQLSGGQQQRVALARSLVVEPGVLLLDEPLSDLDAKLRVEMRKEIRKLQLELKTTMIYVTHDQEEAMAISDYLAVMNEGKIKQVGNPAEIYRRPDNEFTARFIGKANYVNGQILAVEEEQVSIDLPFGSILAKRTSDDIQTGDEVGIMFRPTEFSITDEKEGVNVIAGTLITSMFLGSLIRYEVDVGMEDNIMVDVPEPEADTLLTEGQELFLRILPDSIYLIPV